MLVPRLFYQSVEQHLANLKAEALQWATGVGECFILGKSLDENKEQIASELKKICLFHNAALLITNEIPLAASIDADGILLEDEDLAFRAREVLKTESMIGVLAQTIEEITILNEEAIIDFIILPRQISRFEIQRILDDCRIMGYNIPILIQSDTEQNQAEAILKMGAYGLVYADLSRQAHMQHLLKQYPLKK